MENIGQYISRYVKGKVPKQLFETADKNTLPYLSPDFLRGKANPEFYAKPTSKTVQVEDGEVIVLWDGSNAGEIFISKKGILGSTMVKLEFDEEIIFKPYFSYSFQYLEYFLKAKTAGSGIPHADKGVIKKLDFFKPPKPEQTAIANILSKVDEAIEATQNSIKAAEKLKKSLMQNLLTGKLKPDGTLRTDDELQITKYGYAFKDWKYCKINDLIKEGYITKVQDGNHGESHPVAAEFVEAGIPFVMASDISKGYVDTDNCKKITKTRADKLRIGFSFKDDVLISHKASVGYTCIVEKAEPYIMLTPQVTLYRVDKQKLIPEYLLYFFQLYTFQIILEGNAKQSTRNYIGITNQKKMWIYLPDAIEEQKELVAPIIKVDKEVIGKQIKIKTLQRLKKSLMQNLLTGKVRVDVEAINKIISEQ